MRRGKEDSLCQKLVQNGRVESDYNKNIIIITLKLYIIIIYIYICIHIYMRELRTTMG